TKPFGVGGHHAVFDAVVHHFDEMPRAARSAMQIALLCCAANFLAARREWNISNAGAQRLENRVESANGITGTADHHAVDSFQPPHPAARSDVHVVDLLLSERLGATDVVYVVRVPAVDQNVA